MARNKKLNCTLSCAVFLAGNEFEAVTDAAHFGGKTPLYRTYVFPPNYAAASSSLVLGIHNIAWDKIG